MERCYYAGYVLFNAVPLTVPPVPFITITTKMNNYRYILQPYIGRNSRFTCPKCNKTNQLTRYIDSDTEEAIAHHVGKCNRIDKCGYHYSPKQYFLDNGIKPERSEAFSQQPQSPIVPTSYIDSEIFLKSLKSYDKNNLLVYLSSFFDKKQVNQLANMYNIGTSSRWNGGTTIFWEVDINGMVRTGKLIKYDDNGHRIKGKNNWVHSILNIENFNLKQCFFGEHLISKFPNKDIAIVESEKTAIIASAFHPGLIWLASGGAEGINTEKVKPLEGRNVILFPDTSMDSSIYQRWSEKAKEFGFTVSDYLEHYTNEEQKSNGLDIADFLLNKNIVNKSIKAPETKFKPEQKLQTDNLFEGSPQIPYNTPSAIALIDSKIENPPKFKGIDLVVKSRIFVSANGDNIELVGVYDYGQCDDRKKHKKAKSYCRACMLNCLHEMRINDKLQKRKYTQLEVLIMQSSLKEDK